MSESDVTIDESSWSGGTLPYAISSKKLGMWLFIVADSRLPSGPCWWRTPIWSRQSGLASSLQVQPEHHQCHDYDFGVAFEQHHDGCGF